MIWCIEDDNSIRDIEMYALQSAGFKTKGFEEGLLFFQALETEIPKLILLDLMLPGMDGIEILKKLKQNPKWANIPIIIASAKGAEFDKITGLDLGADDFLVKPFSMMEMVSRVKAVLRRYPSTKEANIYQYKDLIINWDEHTVNIQNKRINLSHKEFKLLKTLLKNPGTAYERDYIFVEVWDSDYIGDSRTLDMHIRTLRQKLGDYGKNIETVRNVGYRWESNNDN